MTRFRVAWVVATVGLTLIISPWRASAAHLEKLDEKIDKYASPPTAGIGAPPPCEASLDQTDTALVSPDGHQANVSISQAFNQVGRDPTCAISDEGTVMVTGTFTIQPDAGESLGDEVRFCLTTLLQAAASATGNYTAAATLADAALSGPLRIVRNPSGTAITEFSFGPQTVTQNSTPVNQSSRSEFSAQIGDEIELTLGQHVIGSNTGIGTASASTFSDITLSLGGCPALAPALSPSGLVILALLLAGLGLFRLRKSDRLLSRTSLQ